MYKMTADIPLYHRPFSKNQTQIKRLRKNSFKIGKSIGLLVMVFTKKQI